MQNQQPYITSSDGDRKFSCFPAAVLAIIVNQKEEVLLMRHTSENGGWQVVNGAMEAGETPLEAAIRETAEEAGSQIQVRPLGTVHVSSFHYDENVKYMLSIAHLFAYEEGQIIPGDDMAGSEYQWFGMDEIAAEYFDLIIPPGEKWLIARAIDLYKLWGKENPTNQNGFNLSVRGKK